MSEFFSVLRTWWSSGIGQIFDYSGNLSNLILDWVVKFFNAIFGGLGDLLADWISSLGLTIEMPATVFNVLDEITVGIGYIIPVSALLPIVNFMLAFYFAKIIFAIYHLIAKTTIKRVKIKG